MSLAFYRDVHRMLGRGVFHVHPLFDCARPISGNKDPSRSSQHEQHSSAAVGLAIDQDIGVDVRFIFDLYDDVFHGFGVLWGAGAGVTEFWERLVCNPLLSGMTRDHLG